MPDAAPTDSPDSYEIRDCPACARIHLVNKTTGKLLGDNEKKDVAPSDSKSRGH